MNFIEKNWKTLSFISAGLIIVGLIAAVVSGQVESKEKKAQENFANLQTQLNQLKEQQSVKDPKISVDLPKLKKDLEDFISKNLGTVATQMAGLNLADILVSEKNSVEALNVLKKVESNSSVLSNILVLKKQAGLLADSDRCKEAIAAWDKILSNKKAEYTFADVQIKQALCYQKLNDTKKAEELLTKVKNNKTEGQEQSSLEAEKVLRLIQFNKTQGS